jgi:hypothetical protein
MSAWLDTDQMHPAERMSLVLLTVGAVALALSHCGPTTGIAAASTLDAACAARDALRASASAAPAAASAPAAAASAP